MKIMVYAGGGGSGGLKTYIKGFLSACHIDRSVQISVICTQKLAEYVRESVADNVKLIVTEECAANLISYVKGNKIPDPVLRMIHKESPDIVYFINNVIQKGTEDSINVLGMHNQLYIDSQQLHRQKLGKTLLSLYIQRHFALKSMKKASAVVFDSHQSMQQCMEKNIKFKKGIIAYCGVEKSERWNEPHDASVQSPIQLLYVSTIFPYKNQEKLLMGIAELKRRGFDLRLHLVGSGPEAYTRSLISRIDQLGLTKEVILHAWVEHSEVKRMIDECDIFVYASSIETSGLGLMEGMVRGAVIACNHESCMPEILGDGGLLFDVHNPVNTADVLQKLIEDPELRKDLSKKALEVSSAYTWENHTKQVFERFRELWQEGKK